MSSRSTDRCWRQQAGMYPLKLLLLLLWMLEEHNKKWLGSCALPRWHLLLLKTTLGERNQWCYQQSISYDLSFTIPKQIQIFLDGWCVVGRQGNQQEENFCISIQFPSLYWKSDQSPVDDVEQAWLKNIVISLKRVACGTVAAKIWLDLIIRKAMVSHKKKMEKQCKVGVESFCCLVDEWLQYSTEKASVANVVLPQICSFSSQI